MSRIYDIEATEISKYPSTKAGTSNKSNAIKYVMDSPILKACEGIP